MLTEDIKCDIKDITLAEQGKNNIEWDEFENRPYDILFTGTYTAPTRIETAINKLPDFLAGNVNELIDMMLSDSSLTIEDAVEQLARNEIYDYINSDLPLHTQTFYLADTYVRCVNRTRLVLELDKCEHKLDLFGGLWEELDLKHATLHREIPFNLTFTVFSKSKLCVNIMPNFKTGSHDRVFSAQLNGAVSLTDSTTLLKQEYNDNESILFFDLNNIGNASSIADSNLDNINNLKKIAQGGYAIAKANHTWANIADIILAKLG